MKPDLLFIHIPKTGGTSISTAMKPYLADEPVDPVWTSMARRLSGRKKKKMPKHMCALEYKTKYRNLFDRMFSVAVVRNPWDWTLSYFNFLKYTDVSPDSKKPWRHKLFHEIKDMEFNEFVEYVCLHDGLENLDVAQRMRRIGHRCFNQSNFLRDLEGNLLVDKIIRFEKLSQGFGELINEMALEPMNLPHTNKSKSRFQSYKDAYCQKSLSLIEEKFAEDISYFQYSF